MFSPPDHVLKPDFFVRRADATGMLAGVRPDDRISAADSAVFAATAVTAGQAGWAYDRVGELSAWPICAGWRATAACSTHLTWLMVTGYRLAYMR